MFDTNCEKQSIQSVDALSFLSRPCGLWQEVDVDFNVGKTKLVSLDWSNNTGAIDVKINWSNILGCWG